MRVMMIDFRIIRLRDVLKNLVKLVILIIGILILTRFFSVIKRSNLKDFIQQRKKELDGKILIEFLDENLERPYEKKETQNFISKELAFVRSVSGFNLDEVGEKEGNSGIALNENRIDEDLADDVQSNPETQVIEEHNKNDVYSVTYSTVKIKNETSINLTQEMLTPDVTIDKSNIIIFHTHTSESYTPTEQYTYQANGNFRTLDTRCNVVGVGNELANRLLKKNINVIHDGTFHDYPVYNGSYTRSMQTVQNILESNSADLVIDLHRDALADSTYGPSVMIGEEKAAQLMFVMGSNEGGLEHPNWLTNLKIAIKIQEEANKMYPGLFKPIILSKYRYNQHLAKGSCIIEVGATGNTMEETLVSMKYLAEIIEKVLEE